MRWSDLLHPERMLAIGAKLFVGLLAFVIAGSVVIKILAGYRLSVGGTFAALAGLALVSVAAYLVRERRLGRRPAGRSTRGAERTPVMEGDE